MSAANYSKTITDLKREIFYKKKKGILLFAVVKQGHFKTSKAKLNKSKKRGQR